MYIWLILQHIYGRVFLSGFIVSCWLIVVLFISRLLLLAIKLHEIFLLSRTKRTQGIDSFNTQEFFTNLSTVSNKQPHLKSTQEEIAEYCFVPCE